MMLSQLLNATVHDTITSIQSSLVSAVSMTILHALSTAQVACAMTAATCPTQQAQQVYRFSQGNWAQNL